MLPAVYLLKFGPEHFFPRNIENHLMTQHGVSMAQYYEEFKHSIKIVNLEITGV